MIMGKRQRIHLDVVRSPMKLKTDPNAENVPPVPPAPVVLSSTSVLPAPTVATTIYKLKTTTIETTHEKRRRSAESKRRSEFARTPFSLARLSNLTVRVYKR
jgi:hypothetical protein